MNAAVDETENEFVQPIQGRDLSWINATLSVWGEWLWENREFEGYPTSDPVAAFVGGAGGNLPGHRIICRDPPSWITLTHVLWIMLPEHEGVAVYAKYVPGVGDDGVLWSDKRKCEILGLCQEAFRQRLHRAKCRIFKWSEARRALRRT